VVPKNGPGSSLASWKVDLAGSRGSEYNQVIVKQIVLAQGQLPLTQEAADAALDAIDFIAAAVRGYDAIDVTNIVRPIWRAHLAYWYPQLPPVTQQWYANAPQMLASIRAQWPLLDPSQRGAVLQQWTMELPQMLWMVDPVLAEAQGIEMQQAQRSQFEELRQMAARGRPAALTEAQAIDELNKRRQSAINLQNFSTQMTANTLNLMAAMSGRSGGWSAH
jgi:hypothetical protein